MDSKVPPTWKTLRLEQIGVVVTGRTPSTSNPNYWNGPYPFITPSDLDNDVFIKHSARTLSASGLKESKPLPENAVLFSCIGTIGKVAISKEECAFNQQFNAIITFEDTCPTYLFYALKHKTHFIKQLAATTAVPIINKSEFSSVQLSIPPLPEQKKIAAILSSVDEAIETTEAVIEQTRTVKKGLLQKLLTRGIGHTEFKKTAIGEIPKSWKVLPLHKIGKLVTGSTPKTNISTYWNGSIPFITPGDISDDYENPLSTKRHLTKLGAEQVKLCPANTILVTCIGSIGKLAISIEPSTFNQQINGVVCHPTSFPQFIYYALSEQRRSLWARAGQQTIPIINKTQFGETTIPLPPINEQIEIAKIIKTFGRKTDLLNVEIKHLKQIKRGLLQDLLTGKVRVNTLDLPALLNAEAPAEASAE